MLGYRSRMSQMPPPPPPATSGQTSTGVATKDGRLTAAGVMMIIQSALVLIVGLWLLSVTTSDVGGALNDLSGGTITFLAILALLVGGGLLTVGIATVRQRNWGRVTTIVLEAIAAVGVLANIVNGKFNGGTVVSIVWVGSMLYLAIKGKPAAA
jgi:hypothetical protein